jgi:putative iron-regulated protein
MKPNTHPGGEKMKQFKMSLSICLMAASMAFAAGCEEEKDDNLGVGVEHDFSVIINQSVNTVIMPTYKNLFDKADALHKAVMVLQTSTTDANLAAAQNAWVETRAPWEQSEAFLFGPVADMGLDPALDSWPVDHVQLDQVLSSTLDLTADTITENLGGGLKGFHTIEYLLWGDNTKTAADFATGARELEYLVAVSESLRNDAETLYKAWATAPAGLSEEEAETYGGFGESFRLSGKAGGRYFSQTDAVVQLINGMADICNEVGTGKIADPYSEQDVSLVESQFSFNSIQDFSDNMRSVQNIYNGSLTGASGQGLTTFVAIQNAQLDARVKYEITAANNAILAMVDAAKPNFRDTVLDPAYAARIEAAQAAIAKVEETLVGDVMNLLYQ